MIYQSKGYILDKFPDGSAEFIAQQLDVDRRRWNAFKFETSLGKLSAEIFVKIVKKVEEWRAED